MNTLLKEKIRLLEELVKFYKEHETLDFQHKYWQETRIPMEKLSALTEKIKDEPEETESAEKIKDRFLAVDEINGEKEYFDTIEEAHEYLQEAFLQDNQYHPDYDCCKIYELYRS